MQTQTTKFTAHTEIKGLDLLRDVGKHVYACSLEVQLSRRPLVGTASFHVLLLFLFACIFSP